MRIQCQNCKQEYDVEDKYAGQSIQCPNCNTLIQLPDTHAVSDKHYPKFKAGTAKREPKTDSDKQIVVIDFNNITFGNIFRITFFVIASIVLLNLIVFSIPFIILLLVNH